MNVSWGLSWSLIEENKYYSIRERERERESNLLYVKGLFRIAWEKSIRDGLFTNIKSSVPRNGQ